VKRLVWLGLVAVWLVAAVSSPRATYAAGAPRGGTTGLASKPDPCGFRYAGWPVVQETANLVSDVAAGGTDDYHANLRDNYLRGKLIGIAYIYDNPSGWQILAESQNIALLKVQGALRLDLDQGKSAKSDLEAAQSVVAIMWKNVAAICPWKGKSTAWTGWLNAFGYESGSTASFHAPKGWRVSFTFECPPSTYGGSETDPGNFILNVQGGAYDGRIVVNALDKGASGITRRLSRGGTYSFQVVSTCYWHVQVVR
jgi:hypothetical protein